MYLEAVKTLHDTGIKYDELLSRIKELNGTVVLKAEKLLEMLKELAETSIKKGNVCSVCLENNATHCFVPCGHAGYCEPCCTRAQRRNRCFICRATVTGLLRIYL